MYSIILILPNDNFPNNILNTLEKLSFDIYLLHFGKHSIYELQKNDKIKYIFFENNCFGENINKVIENIKTKYLLFHNINFKLSLDLFEETYDCDLFLCNNGFPSIKNGITNNLFYYSFIIKTDLFNQLNGFNEHLETSEYVSYEFLYRINKLGYFVKKGNKFIEKINTISNVSYKDKFKMDIIKNINIEQLINIYKLPKYITMIDLGYNGRLGNQLFQYAMLYSLSKLTGRNIILIKNKNHTDEFKENHLKYFNIKYLFLKDKINFTNFNEINFEYEQNYINDILTSHSNIININGFFQSFKYFSQYENDLKNIYTLKTEYDIVQNLYKQITKNTTLETVAIHVRHGDYIKYPNYHFILPIDYYKKALDILDNKFYIICSDNIEWCKKEFNFIHINNVYYSREKYYIDLILMSLCNHNIIANSSFSWWSAYLNKNPNKIVISPKKWFSQDGPKYNIEDIIPASWIKI